MKQWEALDDEELQNLIEKAKQNPPTETTGKKCDRLTSQFQMVHESCGQQPIMIGVTFSYLLAHKEQPYQRRIEVGEAQVALDLGWLKDVGYIVIENKRTTGHSKEEKEKHELHRILVLVDKLPIFQIAPGKLFVCELYSKEASEHLSLASTFGACPVNINVFPN